MKFKLKPNHFTSRIPLTIARKNNTIYFSLQHEILGNEGYRRGLFCEYDKINTTSFFEIGSMAVRLLDRFHEISDFTIHELEDMLSNNDSVLPNESNCKYLEFIGAKDNKDFCQNYDHASIGYVISENKYNLDVWWYKKGLGYIMCCKTSQGEKGVLTFDKPIDEFNDYSDPESLGHLIAEALDRSRQITDKAAGNPYPSKDIEILSGAKLTISAPRNKHFTDDEDHGVGELYQAYTYFPREDSEESSAEFYLGIAAELNCDMSEKNIRSAWEELHGKSEFFEVKSVEYGIFKLRAEMRNKSVHRISYLLQINETELLDCTMELHKPNSRKKLDEKLSGLFEEFAGKCKYVK